MYLSGKSKLTVISDTAMSSGESGEIAAFEPVVREIDQLAIGLKSVDWLGYYRFSSLPVNHKIPSAENITMISVQATGGNTLKDKISILTHLPVYLFIILDLIKKNNIIYTRGPSVPALLVILLSFFINNKIYLHKYAGGWDLKSIPFFYSFQRWMLKKIKRGYVIVSATLKNDSNSIISLPNPCLDVKEIQAGYSAIKSKEYSNGLRVCFAGKCVASKGIFEVLDTVNLFADYNILGNCIIAGDGDINQLKECLNPRAKRLTKFPGALSRQDLNKVYYKSHFILLPSRSEGFPKVLAEAAAFGCIPVVSKLPGIDKIIQDNVNGILLEDLFAEKVFKKIKRLWADQVHMEKMARGAHEFSKQFSYDSFLHSIKHLLRKG